MQAKLNNNAPTINVDHGIAHPGCYNYTLMNNTSYTNETSPTTDERTDITEKVEERDSANSSETTDIPDQEIIDSHGAMPDLRIGSGSTAINDTNAESTELVTNPTSKLATRTTTTRRPTYPRAAKGGNKSQGSSLGYE